RWSPTHQEKRAAPSQPARNTFATQETSATRDRAHIRWRDIPELRRVSVILAARDREHERHEASQEQREQEVAEPRAPEGSRKRGVHEDDREPDSAETRTGLRRDVAHPLRLAADEDAYCATATRPSSASEARSGCRGTMRTV